MVMEWQVGDGRERRMVVVAVVKYRWKAFY